MINQTTPKATLNQMLSAILSRMENKTLEKEMKESALAETKTEEQQVTGNFINSMMDEVLDNVI